MSLCLYCYVLENVNGNICLGSYFCEPSTVLLVMGNLALIYSKKQEKIALPYDSCWTTSKIVHLTHDFIHLLGPCIPSLGLVPTRLV